MESATKPAGALPWGDHEGLPQQGFLSGRTFFIRIFIQADANRASPDLPKLFVQIRGIHQCPLFYFLVVHLLVPRDEEGAQELLHLYRNVHGDWDNEIEEDHKWQEVREHPQDLRWKGEKMMQSLPVRRNSGAVYASGVWDSFFLRLNRKKTTWKWIQLRYRAKFHFHLMQKISLSSADVQKYTLPLQNDQNDVLFEYIPLKNILLQAQSHLK